MKIEICSPEYYELAEKLKVQLELIPPNAKIDKTFNESLSIMFHSDNELAEDEVIISKADVYGLINIDGEFIYGVE